MNITVCFCFLLGFTVFIENMRGLITNIQSKKNWFFQHLNLKKKLVIKKSYYGAHLNSDKVTNDVKLDKSMIITGPNASGKNNHIEIYPYKYF